jgi:DNA-directed RNA polymerase specialized sigma24 family protein
MKRYPEIIGSVGSIAEQINAIAVMRHFHLPYPDIAKLLGISIRTVYRRIKT